MTPMDRSPLRISWDGMTFDLPDDGPLLAGPASAGGNATVRGGDGRPQLSVVTEVSAPLPDADLYVVREEALAGRRGRSALRRVRRRAPGALIAGPPSSDGTLDRW